MAMELKLVPKLSQQLVMTPQLKMAIKLLTLNHLELSDAVAQELVENPVLEENYDDTGRPQEGDADIDAGTQEPTNAAAEKAVNEAGASEVSLDGVGTEQQKDNAQEIDWEAYAESYSVLPASAGSGSDTNFDDMPGYDQTLTRAETLEEHMLWQIRMADFNELEREIAVRLVGEMNDEGFLDNNPLIRPPELVPEPALLDEGADAHVVEDLVKSAMKNGEDLLADGSVSRGLLQNGVPSAEGEPLLSDGLLGAEQRSLEDTPLASPALGEEWLKDGPSDEGMLQDGAPAGANVEYLLQDGPQEPLATDPV
jgi:hypothetical protein